MSAVALYKKAGAAIALFCALLVNVFSDIAYAMLAQHEPFYVYYATIFLIVFAWWTVVCNLQLFYSQIISGVATVFMSITVVDCYFSSGYETLISACFPSVVIAINILTILAAWNDRNWTCPISINSRGKSSYKNSEANNKC